VTPGRNARSLGLPRLVHRATDSLSEIGQQVLLRGFENRLTYAAIARSIQETTGEHVAPRTVARRGSEWRAQQRTSWAGKEILENALLSPLDRLDASPGWHLRRRRSVIRALRAFFRSPLPSTLRRLKDELLLFWLEARIDVQGQDRR